MYIKTSISEIERITQEVFSYKGLKCWTKLTNGHHELSPRCGKAPRILYERNRKQSGQSVWTARLHRECCGLRKLWAGCNGHSSRGKVWAMGQRVLVHTQRGRSPHVLQTDSDQMTKEGCLCAHRSEVGNLSEGQHSPQQGVQVCNSCVATEALTQENKI